MTEVLCWSKMGKACELIFATPFMAYAMSTGDPYVAVDALMEEGYNSRVANAAMISAYTEIRNDTVGVLDELIDELTRLFDVGPDFMEELYDDHPDYAASVHAQTS